MLRFTHKELSLQILNKIAKINRLTNSCLLYTSDAADE